MLRGLPTVDGPGANGFEPFFMQSKGEPIQYHGHQLVLMDRFPLFGCGAVRVALYSARSEWRQGLRFDSSGLLTAETGESNTAFAFWFDSAPRSFTIAVQPGLDQIQVRNIWDTGDGVMHSWHFGAAMIVEEIDHGRRYHCNDGHPDDGFDDFVFAIERVFGSNQHN